MSRQEAAALARQESAALSPRFVYESRGDYISSPTRKTARKTPPHFTSTWDDFSALPPMHRAASDPNPELEHEHTPSNTTHRSPFTAAEDWGALNGRVMSATDTFNVATDNTSVPAASSRPPQRRRPPEILVKFL